MRILHVVPSYLPAVRYGGPIQSVHGLCRALAARGNDVHVFATNVDGPYDSAVPLEQPVELDGVRVWYFPSKRLRRLFWSPPLKRALERELPGFDLAHLHSVFLWPTWAAARAAGRLGVPYVVAPRGMLVRDLIRRRSWLVKSLWLALIERGNLEGASAVHATSEIEATELRAFGWRLPPVHIVPNGIDPADATAATAAPSPAVARVLAGGPYVLFLGRLSWKKRLDRLIDAMKDVPGVRLVIAGNDDEGVLPALRRWIEEAGLTERTALLPFYVTGADKRALLEGAQVFAMPSLSENFGIAALEAMAAGCPPVMTEGVGLSTDVGRAHAGLVVAEADLSRAIGRLVGDEGLRRALGANARRFALERFGWDRIAGEMEAVYRGLIHPGRQAGLESCT